jgi:hypothetical protein
MDRPTSKYLRITRAALDPFDPVRALPKAATFAGDRARCRDLYGYRAGS